MAHEEVSYSLKWVGRDKTGFWTKVDNVYSRTDSQICREKTGIHQ